jgi:hypothetical protein
VNRLCGGILFKPKPKRLSVALNVLDGAVQNPRVVIHKTNCPVVLVTQKTTNLSGVVAVIDRQHVDPATTRVYFGFRFAAYVTGTALVMHHCQVILHRQTVFLFDALGVRVVQVAQALAYRPTVTTIVPANLERFGAIRVLNVSVTQLSSVMHVAQALRLDRMTAALNRAAVGFLHLATLNRLARVDAPL